MKTEYAESSRTEGNNAIVCRIGRSFPPYHGAMTHEPRLTQALRTLLQTQRVAALGTLSRCAVHDGAG